MALQPSHLMIDVSIIIPVFNKLAFTRQCLNRIERHLSGEVRFEVIVVDNGSTDGTKDFFTGTASYSFPHTYHRSEENLGFSRANNIGARLSSAKYLLFLNNDTIVRPGWLDAMVQVAEADDRVGIVGIKQLFPYTNSIHHTGIIFTADRTTAAHLSPPRRVASARQQAARVSGRHGLLFADPSRAL